MIFNADAERDQATLDARAAQRAALFRETPVETLERWILGLAWPLRPNRIGGLPVLAQLWLADLIAPSRDLPDPEHAFTAAGLCGMVHDLSVPTLVEAYRRGLFTFTHVGPLKWLSLHERCVLFFDDLHISKTLRRYLRQGRYTVTFDRDFEGVIKACAGRRKGKWHVTWITPRIMRTYANLYDAGYAHSYEVWDDEGALIGGGYGVAIGGTFVIESMFSHQPHTSKYGLIVLNWHLAKWGFIFNDNKWPARAMLEMGFKTIPRRDFLGHLAAAVRMPGQSGRWQIETDLRTVADRPNRPAHANKGTAMGAAPEPIQGEARQTTVRVGSILRGKVPPAVAILSPFV